MIPSEEDIKRQVIPRWRSIKATAAAGEIGSAVRRRPSDLETHFAQQLFSELDMRLAEWRADQDLASAEELLNAAIVANKAELIEVKSAARLIVDSDFALQGSRQIATSVLSDELAKDNLSAVDTKILIRREISRRKKLLRIYPRDALLSAETALLHTRLGNVKAASDLLKKAAAIAPNDRYVLRSLTRLWVHSGERDKALHYLSKSGATKFDPWLLSSLLAVEDLSDKQPTLWRDALRMLDHGAHSDFDLAELAAASATLEMGGGNLRRARKMFRRSLLKPTENALAQAQWAHRRDPAIKTKEALRPDAFEALASAQLEDQRWNDALKSAESWQDMEPFSVRPAVMGSFIAVAYLGQGDRAEEICRKGLIANPGASALHNNLAVALAIQSKPDQALVELKEAKQPRTTVDKIVRVATLGLIEMRSGHPHEGSTLYQQSLQMAVDERNPTLWCRAAAHFVLECARYDKTGLSETIEKVEQVYLGLNKKTQLEMTDVPALLKRAQGVTSADELVDQLSSIREKLVHYKPPAS